MVKLSTVIKRNPKIISRQIKNQVFILDVRSGEIRTLNEVAGFIWKLTKKKIPVNKIVERICAEYEVKPEIAKRDTLDFVKKYLELGILEKSD